MTYTFTGTSTTLYGMLAFPYGVNASIALDAQPASAHVLPPPLPTVYGAAVVRVAYNTTLYAVAGLAPGAHTLRVRLQDWMGGASAVGVDYAGVDEELLAGSGPPLGVSSFAGSSTGTSSSSSAAATSTTSTSTSSAAQTQSQTSSTAARATQGPGTGVGNSSTFNKPL